MNKVELRKSMAAILAKVDESERQRQSREVLARVIAHPRYKEAKRISVYLSTEREIDTLPIICNALEVVGKKCFIPYVRRRQSQVAPGETRMVMVELNSIKSYHELESNHYGIKEPRDIHGWPRASPTDNPLDLILVPGVAFGPDGKRLGHGKGYYDEFLLHWTRKAQSRTYTIGLALNEQLVDDVHASSDSDFQLDEILCEKSK